MLKQLILFLKKRKEKIQDPIKCNINLFDKGLCFEKKSILNSWRQNASVGRTKTYSNTYGNTMLVVQRNYDLQYCLMSNTRSCTTSCSTLTTNDFLKLPYNDFETFFLPQKLQFLLPFYQPSPKHRCFCYRTRSFITSC